MAAGLGFKTFTTGEVLTAADTNGYLMQGVLVFASAAARDAAITSPQEGQYAYLKDTNVTTYYTGSAWANADTSGMSLLSTTTLSGVSTSIAITPTGYNSLYIFVTGVGCSTNTDFFAQINSVTATTYVNSSLGTIDAGTGSVNGLKNGCYFNFAGANGYGTSTDNALVLQIPDPNGTKRKSMIFNAAYQLTGAAAVQFGMANANTSAAISTIKFELSGGATFSGGGTVTVYGVK